MKIKDFSFDLPSELIAQVPSKDRDGCKLLVIDKKTGSLIDSNMTEFPKFLEKDSILVINNTKVRKARVFGLSQNGGKVEFLFNGISPETGLWTAMVSKSKKQKLGKEFSFFDREGKLYCKGQISGNLGDLKEVKFDQNITEEFFLSCGHVPLPPYIKREDCFADERTYQTVFAQKTGSMAAPTAGLHYTKEMLDEIKKMGIQIVEITLHVGMGTFLPVRTENIEDHVMHYESYSISQESAEIINNAKKQGKKLVATGTTSVRTLESAWNDEKKCIMPGIASTNLFITPGFKFHVVDQLLTNFHTPESTLLVLVSAFASREIMLNAYEHAVSEKYRFFSYGDATFIK